MIAIITGITGQDGHFLKELLLSKNYHIVALYRRCSPRSCSEFKSTTDITYIEGDIIDKSSIELLLNKANDLNNNSDPIEF